LHDRLRYRLGQASNDSNATSWIRERLAP
jgi:hypothetical protein